jgi:hypothetical protein
VGASAVLSSSFASDSSASSASSSSSAVNTAPSVSTLLSQELDLPEYDDCFEDYLELVVQYALTSMFACVLPLAPLLALANNLVEVRSDALKLTHFRRPAARPPGDGPCVATRASAGVSDEGGSSAGVSGSISIDSRSGLRPWAMLLRAVSHASVLSNLAILVFATDLFDDWLTTPAARAVAVIAAEHVVVAFRALSTLDTEPSAGRHLEPLSSSSSSSSSTSSSPSTADSNGAGRGAGAPPGLRRRKRHAGDNTGGAAVGPDGDNADTGSNADTTAIGAPARAIRQLSATLGSHLAGTRTRARWGVVRHRFGAKRTHSGAERMFRAAVQGYKM